jgi:hypothetical protein
MEVIEPASVYAQRRSPAYTFTSPALHRPHELPSRGVDDFWTCAVLDTLRENGDEPLRITTLVNVVAKLGNFRRRQDYDDRRVQLLKLVGRLMRIGRIDRVARKYAAIARSNERYQAYLALAKEPLDLPPPDL